MKKFLLASSILASTAGFAAADVTLSGSARMGIIDGFGAGSAVFTSRARVVFTLSGETDGGLAFGATFRADNAAGANSGTAGNVFISGQFGKLSMGDVDGAAKKAVGNVSGVGLTGLGDYNEIAYLTGNEDPTALYEYTINGFGVFLSGNTTGDYSVAANYKFSNYMVGIGYEQVDAGSNMTGSAWGNDGGNRKMGFANTFINGASQFVIGADASFGAVTAKIRYAKYDEDNFDGTMAQTAASLDYKMDALTLTAFYSDFRGGAGYDGRDGDFYGVGAGYSLGGGAELKGGYVSRKAGHLGGGVRQNAFDVGVTFSF